MRKVVVVVLLIAAGFGIAMSPLAELFDPANIRAQADDIAALWYAPLVLLAAWIVWGLVALPAWALFIAAGVIWGAGLGTLFGFIGAPIGAAAGFALGRWMQPDDLSAIRSDKLRSLILAVRRESLGLILILRAFQVGAFMMINVAAGAAGMRFGTFLLATMLGMAGPIVFWSTFGNIWIDHGWAGLLEENRWCVPAGAAIGALLIAYFGRRLQRRAGTAPAEAEPTPGGAPEAAETATPSASDEGVGIATP